MREKQRKKEISGETTFIWSNYPYKVIKGEKPMFQNIYFLLEGDPGFGPHLAAASLVGERILDCEHDLVILNKFQNFETFNTSKEFNLPGWKGYIVGEDLWVTIPTWPPMSLSDGPSVWIYAYPMVSDLANYFNGKSNYVYYIGTTSPNNHFMDEAFPVYESTEMYDLLFVSGQIELHKQYSLTSDGELNRVCDAQMPNLFFITPQWIIPQMFSEMTINESHLLMVGADDGDYYIDDSATKTLTRFLKQEKNLRPLIKNRKPLIKRLEAVRTAKKEPQIVSRRPPSDPGEMFQ